MRLSDSADLTRVLRPLFTLFILSRIEGKRGSLFNEQDPVVILTRDDRSVVRACRAVESERRGHRTVDGIQARVNDLELQKPGY
jgi:hypothetical protein